jgi:cytochrome c
VLVFSRTTGFRHDTIPEAVAAIGALGAEQGFAVDATEDPAVFTEEQLAQYRAVIFLLTTGEVLSPEQKGAFEHFIQAGHGYVGVHSASDTEYGWPWYGGLVGAYFQSHPIIQEATLHVEDPSHPSTVGLPEPWVRTDEWYNFRANPRVDVQVLLRLDEASYSGGAMGGDHPVAWYHAYDGGRAWYTAGGHTGESYHEPLFLQHLLGGIQYAAGLSTSQRSDPSDASAPDRVASASPPGALVLRSCCSTVATPPE